MTTEDQITSPDFSILIGMVSTEDERRILEALDMLRQQQGHHTYEVIIGDRRNDDVSAVIRESYSEVKLLPAASGTTLPVLRTSALEQASGKYIIVTEDHCVPSIDWLSSIFQAFKNLSDETVAVGGCIENGVCDRSFDWATFFCEYSSFLQPVYEGFGNNLPGMNIAYKKEVFVDVDREILTSGFWETTLHPQLVKQGFKLFSTNKIKLVHSKKFTLGLFMRQRFIYSRYYAGLRYKSSQYFHRFFAFCATVFLPPLLLYRMSRQIFVKERFRMKLFSASPYLVLFIITWAAGEMWGYMFGANEALAAIE